MRNIKKELLVMLLGLIAYRIILDVVYVNYICTLYGYVLHFKVDTTVFKYTESWILFLVIAVPTILGLKRKTIQTYFLQLQLILTITPMLTIMGLYNRSRVYIYIICACHFLQIVICYIVRKRIILNTILLKKTLIFAFIGVAILSVIIVFLQYGIPDTRALNFSKVYEVRAENVFTSGIMGYVVPWFFNVFLPIGLVYLLEKKKSWNMLLLCIPTLFLYLTFAHKAWLFCPFITIISYYILKRGWFNILITCGVPISVLSCYIIYILVPKLGIIPSLFIRRLLFVPADIKYEYYNFFSKNPKLHFSEGLLGSLIGTTSSYSKNSALIIGDELHEYGSSCNTGYLADAYAQGGIICMFLFAIILIILLIVIDIFSKKEMFVANMAIMVYPLIGFNDSALLTKMLTGGMILIILYIVLSNGKEPRIKRIKRVRVRIRK